MTAAERPAVGTRVEGEQVFVRVGDSEHALDWQQAVAFASLIIGSAVLSRGVDLYSLCRTDDGLVRGHDWVLTEDGYARAWSTVIEGDQITAYFDGSSDFSEDGDGVYLECSRCGATCEVPDHFEVDYR